MHTDSEKINATYSVHYKSGIDYSIMSILANNKKLASYAGTQESSSETSHKLGWSGFVLLEKYNILLFISDASSTGAASYHLLVSVNGAIPLDITDQVLDWAWQHKDYEDRSAKIELGPLKVEEDQLKVGLSCPTNSDLKINRKTSIPLSVIHGFIAKLPSQPAEYPNYPMVHKKTQ